MKITLSRNEDKFNHADYAGCTNLFVIWISVINKYEISHPDLKEIYHHQPAKRNNSWNPNGGDGDHCHGGARLGRLR